MKNWTIRQRITASFSVVILLVLVMGSVALSRLIRIEHAATAMLTDPMPGLYFSMQIMAELNRNFSVTQELGFQQQPEIVDGFVEELRISQAKMEALLDDYAPTITEPAERQRFDAVKHAFAPYVAGQQKILRLTDGLKGDQKRLALDKVDVIVRDELDGQCDKVRFAVQALVDANKLETDDWSRQIMATVASAKIGLLISFGAALGLALVSGYYLLQSVTQPLSRLVKVMAGMRRGDFTQRIDQRDEFGALGEGVNRMADELKLLFGQVQKSGIQVGTSVTEIGATAREQQATASEIAATTSEIGATAKEISATSKVLVKTMSEVSTMADQTATLATSGQTGLSRMEETMHHVVGAAGAINAKLAVLNEKAGNINQVVITITKVADQTNLLSLNAAIEAEKAGEYGRGFAVVASEIRRLADQTAVATYDIEQTVKEIQSAVAAGVMGMDKFSEEVRRGMLEVQQVGGQLSQIIQQVQALTPRFESVNEGMQAQAAGAEQISQALTQLSEAAQQTVESLRQSGLAIDELTRVADDLHAGVSRFKLQA